MKIVTQAYYRARYTHREWLLDPQYSPIRSPMQDPIVGVLPYMERSSDVANILRSHWQMLTLQACFQQPLRLAFSRGTNLNNQLVKTALMLDRPVLSGHEGGHYSCNECSYCQKTVSGVTWQHPVTLREYTRRWKTTCQTAFVVYLVCCPCGLWYVGRTIRSMRKRLAEHASRIRNKVLTAPMVEHCAAMSHAFEELTWTIIDHIPLDPRRGDRELKLQRTEQRWIFELHTIHPSGLNREIDWATIL